jgi:hypothetical protein
MYEDIMRRPMFQNAQQRAGSGIMAGVAPVQGFDNGGEAIAEEDGLAEQAFKLLVVDPDDELDVALASASAMLMASGMAAPGAVALTAARLGIKGRKLYKALDKAQEVGKKLASPTKSTLRNPLGELEEAPGVVSRIAAPVMSNIGVREIDDIAVDPVGYATDTAEGMYDLGEETVGLGGDIYDIATKAEGGIVSLPVNMKDGGKLDLLASFIKNIRDKLKRGEIDESDIPKELKPKVQVDTSGTVIDRDRPTSARRESTITSTDTKPVTKNTDDVAEEAVEDAKVLEKGKKKPKTTTGKILTGAKLAAMLGIPVATVATFIAANPEIIGDLTGQGFELDDDVQDAVDQLGDTTSEQEATAQGSGFTLNEMPNLPAVVTPGASSEQQADETTTESSEEVVTTPAAPFQQQEVEEERKKVLPGVRPFGGKIARALLGDDEAFGGDRGAIDFIRKQDPQAEGGRGFLDNVMSKLGDPRVQYQLAKAGQATEGFVPRNFGSDVTLAGAEYDDALAQREYIKAQTEDKSTTELEKLTDFFMSTIDTSGADEPELLSLRNQIATSLNNMSRDEARQTLAAELVKAFGDDQYGIQAVKEIMQQLDTGESLTSIISRYKDYRQANQK